MQSSKRKSNRSLFSSAGFEPLESRNLLSANPLPLADVNNVPGTSDISTRLVLGSQVLFVADDGQNGQELWASNPTTGAASLLKDVNPDGDSSPLGLTVMNGEAYFLADSGDQGFELWKTNGTSAATTQVKNVGQVFPGETNLPWTAVNNNKLYFSLASNLWISDGTEGGTQLLKTFDAAVGSRGTYPRHLTPIGSEVFFVAIDNTGLRQLWKTDGTTAGTVLISNVQAGELAAGSGFAFFTATNESGGQLLWRTDGTPAGTFQLSPTSGVSRLNMHEGKAYFSLADQLWVSDGTVAGTAVLASNVAPVSYQSVGSSLYFSGIDNTNDLPGLWVTDGTVAGTRQLNTGATADGLAAFGNDLVYTTVGVAPGYVAELRRVTAAGATTVLKSINGSARAAERGDSPATLRVFTELVTLNQQIFFAADDGVIGRELFVSNGTAVGTILLKDINPGKAFSTPSLLTPVVDRIFFVADNGEVGFEPWQSDGTSEGTTLVQDINAKPAAVGSSPNEFTQVGDTVYFVANTQEFGRELWKTDGSRANTVMVADIATGDHFVPDFAVGLTGQYLGNNADPHSLVGLGNKVYFLADDGVHGSEVWTSDGTTTQRLADDILSLTAGSVQQLWSSSEAVYFIVASTTGHTLWQIRTDGNASVVLPSSSILPVGLGVAGGRVVFTTQAANGDALLWSTNMTTTGTTQLINSRAAATSALVVGNTLLLSVDLPNVGQTVWVTDGTTAGTQLLVDNVAGAASPTESPAAFLSVRNGVGYFLLKGSSGTVTLWQSNGVTASAVSVLPAGVDIASPGNSMASSSYVYFLTRTTAGSLQLQRTDGTAGGTVLLRDLGAGVGTSQEMAIFNDLLYFVATDGTNGTELWKSDGSVAGTVLAHNVQPIAGLGSSPANLQVVNDGILFAANVDTGSEPWLLLDNPWHNVVNPVDVNSDDFVVAFDVILVINELNQRNLTDPVTGLIPPTTSVAHDYLDVNRDGFVAPIDALVIISTINNRPAAASIAVNESLIAAALDALDDADSDEESSMSL